MQLKINGKRHWLWRAVDKHGVVLDILVQQRRDQYAAETFLRRVLAAAGSEPRVVITDKLASYPPALRRVLPNTEHRRHKGLNNRAENSHQPTRQRERVMRRFKSPEQAQAFSNRSAPWAITSEPAAFAPRPSLDDNSWRNGVVPGERWSAYRQQPESSTSTAGQLIELRVGHPFRLLNLTVPASHLNRIECHFQPLREFVLNASDHSSHTEVARAFRRYLPRRNTDQHNSRIRLLESRSRVA